jgi:hypothetical protein
LTVLQADRSTVTINDLQRKTIDYIHARHQPDEPLNHREASYLRDEVTGPLGTATARVGEFEGVVGAGDLGTEQDSTDTDPEGRTIERHVVYEEITEVVREPCPTESEADVSVLSCRFCILVVDVQLGKSRPRGIFLNDNC